MISECENREWTKMAYFIFFILHFLNLNHLFPFVFTQTIRVIRFTSQSSTPGQEGVPLQLGQDCHTSPARVQWKTRAGKGMYIARAAERERPLSTHSCLLACCCTLSPHVHGKPCRGNLPPLLSRVSSFYHGFEFVLLPDWSTVDQAQVCTWVMDCDIVFTDLQWNKEHQKNIADILQAQRFSLTGSPLQKYCSSYFGVFKMTSFQCRSVCVDAGYVLVFHDLT